jgi:hypothetical protein
VLDPANPNNVKELQKLSFNTEDKRETHRLTITNPDNGKFKVSFTSPELKRSLSDEMRTNDAGSTISHRMRHYFRSVGVNTSTTRKLYDDKDVETSDIKKAKKIVLEIKIDRLVKTPRTSSMAILKLSTKSTFKLERNVVTSGPPMTGKFKVRCLYPDPKNPGKFTYEETKALNLNSDTFWLTRHIGE